MTFADDFTHFVVVYLLGAKSEVFQSFVKYEAMATAKFNLPISRLRCDNGTEFVSTKMMNFLEMKGIVMEPSIRFTPQQNGVSERMGRTIVEKARCMLLGSKLSKNLWTEAVKAATYVVNRCPTAALSGKVPAELWHGRKPDLTKLRVFGCIAYLRLPKQLINGKFESRTIKCFHIGYCANGYRLWSAEEKKVILGYDVFFDETKFVFEPTVVPVSERFIQTSDAPSEPSQSETPPVHPSVNQGLEEANQSNEPELRRSERIRRKPSYLDDYCELALSVDCFSDEVPKNFSDIETRPDSQFWKQAVDAELASLKINNTWTLV